MLNFLCFLYCLMHWNQKQINIAPYEENVYYFTYQDKI